MKHSNKNFIRTLHFSNIGAAILIGIYIYICTQKSQCRFYKFASRGSAYNYGGTTATQKKTNKNTTAMCRVSLMPGQKSSESKTGVKMGLTRRDSVELASLWSRGLQSQPAMDNAHRGHRINIRTTNSQPSQRSSSLLLL